MPSSAKWKIAKKAFFLIIALLERCEGDRPLKYRDKLDKYDLRSNFC
jgi:hypothetical protein